MTLPDLAAAADFTRLVAAWQIQGRCPLGLVDLLLENGLEAESEGARWAADRVLDEPDLVGGGVFVIPYGYGECFEWSFPDGRFVYDYDVPKDVYDRLKDPISLSTTAKRYSSFEAAVVALLAAWALARPRTPVTA